jgi:hypothetical protein
MEAEVEEGVNGVRLGGFALNDLDHLVDAGSFGFDLGAEVGVFLGIAGTEGEAADEGVGLFVSAEEEYTGEAKDSGVNQKAGEYGIEVVELAGESEGGVDLFK